MGFATYLSDLLVDLAFGRAGSPYSPPPVLYVGLSTSAPNPDGSGVSEPAGGAYARVAVPNDADHWADAGSQPSAGRTIANAAEIPFPKATAPWGSVGFWLIYDAPNGGNLLAFATLQIPVPTPVGTTLTFLPGSLTLQVS